MPLGELPSPVPAMYPGRAASAVGSGTALLQQAGKSGPFDASLLSSTEVTVF